MTKGSKNQVPGSPKGAGELLDMYFLQARSYLLETAAVIDRIERAGGGKEPLQEPRLQKLIKALEVIKEARGNRTEQFLIFFSE
jgi:hypothetical protein